MRFFNLYIQITDKSYVDTEEISPEEIYRIWREEGILPKTAAVSPGDYLRHFEKWVKDGYDVVHINIGSGLSSSYQNCCLAAKSLGHVYPIDSQNLSTGCGNLVVKAGEMIEAGFSAEEIQKKITEMTSKSHGSFVLDTLEFMRAGGRCSAVAAVSADLLKLKPCILVNNQDGGKMNVGKKYRGAIEKVLSRYVEDTLSNYKDIDYDRVFITHSGSLDSDIELVKEELLRLANFKEIHVTRASCTISAHCGPRTLGILFMTK